MCGMKAIIPIAGFGTRLLPLTARLPKALVPVAGKPMIDYAVNEAKKIGVTELLIICSPEQLRFKQEILNTIPPRIKTRFKIQPRPNGNAVALLKGKSWIAGENVLLVLYPDDILTLGAELMKEARTLAAKTNSPVLILDRIPWTKVSHYGVVGLKKKPGKYREITNIVEKPDTGKAPSNFTVVGHYAIPGTFWKYIVKLCSEKLPPNSREYGLTDALRMHLQNGGKIYGIEVRGKRFDCGSHLGLKKANTHFA